MKMKKIKMPSTKSIGKAFSDAGKAIEKTANDAGKAIEKTANDAGDAIDDTVDTVSDAVNDVIKETQKALDESAKWMLDTDARAKNIKSIVDKVKSDAKKAGLPIDQYVKEFNQGADFIQGAVTEGVEAVEWVVQYLEQNACQMALTSALSLAFFTILNPTNPEAEASAAPLSAAAIAYMAAGAAGKMVLATACYEFACLIATPIYAIPEVKNALSKDGKKVLCSALGNAIYYSIEAAAAAWTVPAAALMMMAAMFSTLIANLACTGTLPNGYHAMYGVNEGYDKNFT